MIDTWTSGFEARLIPRKNWIQGIWYSFLQNIGESFVYCVKQGKCIDSNLIFREYSIWVLLANMNTSLPQFKLLPAEDKDGLQKYQKKIKALMYVVYIWCLSILHMVNGFSDLFDFLVEFHWLLLTKVSTGDEMMMDLKNTRRICWNKYH